MKDANLLARYPTGEIDKIINKPLKTHRGHTFTDEEKRDRNNRLELMRKTHAKMKHNMALASKDLILKGPFRNRTLMASIMYGMGLSMGSGYATLRMEHLFSDVGRFFYVTSGLPMELQLLFCGVVHNISPDAHIPQADVNLGVEIARNFCMFAEGSSLE